VLLVYGLGRLLPRGKKPRWRGRRARHGPAAGFP
jgi:hypothetical protein